MRPTSAGAGLPNRPLQVAVPATTSGTGGRVGPTSNDAADPSPIADFLANADHAVAPAETTAPRSGLLATPYPS
jgi:hypothetical protein